MPASKKPRKKGRPRSMLSPFRIKAEHIEEIKAVFTHFELTAELKLPRGTFDAEDVSCLRTVLYMAYIGFMRPKARSWLDVEAVREHEADFLKARQAFAALEERGKASGRYVCTAEELNLIRDAVALAGTYAQESLKRCPRLFLKEWLAMQLLRMGRDGRVEYDVATIERAIALY